MDDAERHNDDFNVAAEPNYFLKNNETQSQNGYGQQA